MHFKYPEILYFLFLLVIPIIVHLFQLRRFKKEYFTNVRFLKNLVVQTRKSSQLKKWLLLITRMLLLAALIIAFAQPFSDARDTSNTNNTLFIILDNSFSMQAKGEKGELLKRSVEDLLQEIPENQTFSLLTNDQNYWDTDISSVQKDLQQISYSNNSFDLETQIGKINSKTSNAGKDIIVITDGIGLKSKDVDAANKGLLTHFIIPKSQKQSNVSIDSIYISDTQDNFYDIAVNVSAYGKNDGNLSMALYNNEKLVAKTLLKLDKSKVTVPFKIAKADFHGYVQIEDNALEYDNTYYFSIENPKKTSVISIGEDNLAGFLKRIYTSEEFDYQNSTIQKLDYSLLQDQDVVVLNELSDIPEALQTNLKAFVAEGGSVIMIPSKAMSSENGSSFLSKFGNYQFLKFADQEKKVSTIAFDNPLYKGVFEKKVDNFEYPTTNSSFEIKSSAVSALKYADQSSFLSIVPHKAGKVYVFSAPLNKQNSNFQNSPLIVPTFFNMAQANANAAISAIKIGSDKSFSAFTSLGKDAVLKVENKDESFIPMQKVFNKKVTLSFADNPATSGNFQVMNKDQKIALLSFNYDRSESDLSNIDNNLLDRLNTTERIDSILSTIKSDRTDNSFWKWFIALCLLFLLTEIAIQKFIK